MREVECSVDIGVCRGVKEEEKGEGSGVWREECRGEGSGERRGVKGVESGGIVNINEERIELD